MTFEELRNRIEEYERKQPNVKIAYGGDGQVLRAVEKFPKKCIIPFRDYGLCEKHEHRLEDFLDGKEGQKDLKFTRCPYIEYKYLNREGKTYKDPFGNEFTDKGIAEIAFKNSDISEALRYNVYVNGKLYLKNVIADGSLVATSYAATGYWKSITRCIFNGDSIGVAFIAPTQGISNLVLDNKTVLKFEFLRNAMIQITADKKKRNHTIEKGDWLEVQMIPEAASIFGLDTFHCWECRKKRHSTIEAGLELQDQYSL